MQNHCLYMLTVFYIDREVHTFFLFLFLLQDQFLSCLYFNWDVSRLEPVLFVLSFYVLSVVSEACSRMSVFNAAPPSLDHRRSLINLAGDT